MILHSIPDMSDFLDEVPLRSLTCERLGKSKSATTLLVVLTRRLLQHSQAPGVLNSSGVWMTEALSFR
jgi:hypothetical protein